MCVSPIDIKQKKEGINPSLNSVFITVPCGKCPECRLAKMQAWTFRIEKELQRSFNPLFVTLTYDNDSVPIVDDGIHTLCRRDIQLFFKRLRKRHSGVSSQKLVYYLCGEYGTKTNRPHYHCILYNLVDIDMVRLAWPYGFDHSLPMKDGAITYVLKYLQKPFVWDKKDPREAPFSLMSKV